MENILLTGKTYLFPDEALRYIAETWSVLVTGRRKTKEGGDALPETVRFFPTDPSDSDFPRVFELGQIRAVWHVSACADGGKAADESTRLETILRLCAKNGVSRLIVLTESSDQTDYRALIRSWSDTPAENAAVEAAVIRLPLMTGTGLERGRLNRILSAMHKGRTIRLDSGGVRQISVMPILELTALLLRMTGETWFRPGVYAADGMVGSIEGLKEILQSIRPDVRILTSEKGQEEPEGDRQARGQKTVRCRIPVTGREQCDGNLREIYRLPTSFNWQRELTSQYAKMQEREAGASAGENIFGAFLRRFGKAAGVVLDVAVMFLIAEALSRITSESVYFKIADVRILYVILMGMMHGLGIGALAAVLECIMLVLRYSEIGISGLLLFYNVENWIPFVYYLTAGVISGYSHKKRSQELNAVKTENDLVRSKYLFLNEAYRTSVSERGALRAQILGEEESYAKVYGAVRNMHQRTPEAVCVEAVRVFRSLLENQTVCIYDMDSQGRTAELLSCCRENASRLTLNLQECPEMMQALQKGGFWKNTRFVQGAPMYAQLVRYRRNGQGGQSGELVLIVTVEQARQEQLSSWYSNHFTILCGLFQDALESASLREKVLS